MTKERTLRLDEIKFVRGCYGERYHWSEQCKRLIKRMVRCLDGSFTQLDITAQVVGATELKGNEVFTGFSPCVPQQRERVVEKNESEPAGTSSEPEITEQAVGARELKRNKDFTGNSPCVSPKRKRGFEKNEPEQPPGAIQEEQR